MEGKNTAVKINGVNKFVYLGRVVDINGRIQNDINERIEKS
jgi:hypothetical protein